MEATPTRATAGLAVLCSTALVASPRPWCRFGTRVAALVSSKNLFDQYFQRLQRNGPGHSVNPTILPCQMITTLMLDLATVTV